MSDGNSQWKTRFFDIIGGKLVLIFDMEGTPASYDIGMTHPDPIDYALPVTLGTAPAPPPPARLRQARWATRAQFLALGVLAGFWGVHIPSVKAGYALSEATLSMVLLAVALGAVVALLTAGRVIAALGAQRTAQITAVLMGTFIALALHWPTLPVLLLSMVLMGSAMSLFDVAINTEGSALESVGQRPIMGNLHGSFSIGGMAGAMVAGLLLKGGMPATWQLGLAGGVVAAWVLFSARGMLPTHPVAAEESTVQNASFQWPTGTLLILGLLAFAGMSAEGAMYDWSVLYLQQDVALPQAQAAWGYAAFSGAMAAARFGGDALRTRYPERSLLRAGGALSAIAMALVLVTAHPVVAFIGLGLVGAGLAMVVPILYNAASRVPGQTRANAIATVSAIGYSGFLLGPPVIGGVAQFSSLTWALALVVPLAGLLAWGAKHVPQAN